ncbi:MAG: methyltransferase domain-containing protein [Acidimicrobiia bacterium]
MADAAADVPRPGDHGVIDVDDLLAQYTVEELAKSADEYFARLDTWDVLLAKPFYSVHESADLLTSFGALLNSLELSHGLTVLDFGVGSGWTSWMLSQLGCRVIASDISSSALEIAAARYARFPLVGHVTQPVFLPFDGHHLDLDDASVDRVACNDAFHHVPNPEEVLAELARVLRPGGVCAMSEPGPEHSLTPQSQSEMRNFRVVERNTIVEETAPQARAVGFETYEVGVYLGLPHFVDAEAFARTIDPASPVPNELVRSFLENRRLIRMRKAGTAIVDSRRRDALTASLRVDIAADWVRLTAENVGPAVWRQDPSDFGLVNAGAHLFSTDGQLLDFDFMRLRLQENDDPIPPGGRVEVVAELPHLEPGRYRVEFDLVAEGVAWFSENGSPTVIIDISR